MGRHAGRSLITSAAAAITLALPGVAAAGWTPSAVPISAPESAIALQVDAGADGTAAAVWSDGATVRAAVKRPGTADFEAPVVIGSGEDPDVAVSRSGVVLAVWTAAGGIGAAERAAGGTSFVDLGLISSAPAAASPQVKFFADGRAAVKLERSGGVNALMRLTPISQFEELLGGSIGNIAGMITGSDMELADESGLVYVAVTEKDGSTARVRRYRAARDASGSFASLDSFDPLVDSGSVASSTTHTHSEPRILAGTRSVITYITNTTTSALGFPTGTTTAVRSITEAIGAPEVLGTVDKVSNGGFLGPVLRTPALAQRSDGTATVTWLKSDNVSVPGLSTSDLPLAATTFGAKDAIEGYGSNLTPLGAPDLSPLPGGALAMIAADGGAVRAAFSSSGQQFGAPQDLVAGSDQPSQARLGGDGAGGLVAAWTQGEGPSRRAWARLYDQAPPTISGAVTPASLDAGQAGLFTADASDAWSGAVADWDFGDGQTATGPSAAHSYAAAGLFAVSVRARDGAGNLSEAIERVVRVTGGPPASAPAPSAPAPSGGDAAKPRDTRRPSITRLSLTRKRFAVAAAKRRSKVRVRRGTTVRFRLSEAAAVTMTVKRQRRGYRRGRSCSLKKPARVRKPRRCTSLRRVGSLRVTGRSGANSVKFKGRVSRRRLARGSYRLSLVAVDPARNRSRTRSISFTIARAR